MWSCTKSIRIEAMAQHVAAPAKHRSDHASCWYNTPHLAIGAWQMLRNSNLCICKLDKHNVGVVCATGDIITAGEGAMPLRNYTPTSRGNLNPEEVYTSYCYIETEIQKCNPIWASRALSMNNNAISKEIKHFAFPVNESLKRYEPKGQVASIILSSSERTPLAALGRLLSTASHAYYGKV